MISGLSTFDGKPTRILAMAATLVLAATALGGGYAGKIDVLFNAPDRIVLQYEFNDFELKPVRVDAQTFMRIAWPGGVGLYQAGAPDVPHQPCSIIIAEDGVTEVTIDERNSSFYEIADVDLAPSKGKITRDMDPEKVPYTFDPGIYGVDSFFPGKLAELETPYILRDHRGQVLRVYPFQYNAATRVLRVYTTMTVVVERIADGGENVLDPGRSPRRLSHSFHDIYREHFVNYNIDGRYNPLDEEGNMLIIVYDAWNANVQPLAAHKNAIGITTSVVNVGLIGNNSTSIKNYIQQMYNTSDLAFVLLVGDAQQVATPTASGGASDPSYAKLAGADNYPDIIVGRFSAETAAHVDTQVLRTIEYEQNQATQQPWFWKGVGIASSQGAGYGDEGQADYVHMDEIRQWLLAAGYTHVDQIYDTNGGTAAQVTAALNQGRGIINYCGHGSTTSWSTTGFSNTHVNALTNDNMLPFIISVACVNGAFTSGTCFAEAWLRATNGSEPTGAVGAYMSSINQSWAPPMEGQDEFNLLLTNVNEPYHTYGAMCFAGSCSMMDDYGAGGVEMYDTWHIFGDPSLRIVGTTAPPTGLRVSPGSGLNAEGPAGGPFTPSSIVYTLENYDNWPLSYQVTKSVNWLTITNGSGTIPALGSATVTVALNAAANALGNGAYSDTVQFTNLTNGDGNTTRPVTLTIGVPTQQFIWTFDTNPGWTISGGQWAFGHPTGQGGGSYGNPDPSNGYTGANVYGVNLNGDYSISVGGPYTLTTLPINLAEITQVSLRFRRWLNSDYQPYVYQTLEVSNNGTTWQSLWNNGSSEIAESAWSYQVYDISPYADNQPTVYIRWGYGVGQSGAWPYSGWNIDDVEIWGLAPGGPIYPLGDMDCDGDVDFDDIDPFVTALNGQAEYEALYPDCNWFNADCDDDGDVDFDDIDPFVALLSQ